jgi:hypothetical protein
MKGIDGAPTPGSSPMKGVEIKSASSLFGSSAAGGMGPSVFAQGGNAGTLSKTFGTKSFHESNQAFSSGPSLNLKRRPHYPTPIFDAFRG